MCGKLTITIKLLDLLNSAIDITVNNSNNLWFNLEIIDFYDLFNLYKVSIDNLEILTNITLEKQKANIILSIEKHKLKEQMKAIELDKFKNTLNTYISKPIKNGIVFIGSTLGTTLGTTVGTAINSTVYEAIPPLPAYYKFALGIVFILYLWNKFKSRD